MAYPKVRKNWMKDPLFPKPKKEHAKHKLTKWEPDGLRPWAARICTTKGCRCMNWCCYQQRALRGS